MVLSLRLKLKCEWFSPQAPDRRRLRKPDYVKKNTVLTRAILYDFKATVFTGGYIRT